GKRRKIILNIADRRHNDMLDTISLRDKVVAIAGASSGIGLETARLLQQHGVSMVLGARSYQTMEEQFRDAPRVLPLALDVTDEQSVQRFFQTGIRHFSRIDAFIYSAGIGVFDRIIDSNTEDFDAMIAVNLRGAYLCCKHAARHMAERGSGHILNVISIAGTTVIPGNGGYSASKFGLLGLTRTLQTELRGRGVRVSAILPGAVDTAFWDDMSAAPDRSRMISASSLAKHLLYILCQPEDAVIDEI